MNTLVVSSRMKSGPFPFLLTVLSLFLLVALPFSAAAVGLQAHWALDDGSGFVASDASGNGNDGWLTNGPVWTEGQVNGAVALDGHDDHIAVSAAPLEMETWGEITLAAWVQNSVGTGAGTDDIVSWWRWNGYPCSDCSFVLTHHRSNRYFFEIKGTSISGGTVSTAWTHVTATYDGSMIRLYINGSGVASAPYSNGLPHSSGGLIIGGQADGSNFFNGLIDEVRVYDHALTDQEVLDLFNNATPEPDTTPPTQPEDLTLLSVDFTTAEMGWAASADPESGVAHYNIFRDSGKIAESTSTAFMDSDLQPGIMYTYEVSAVNGQGLESLKSDPLEVTTLADTTPPVILSVEATETSVTLYFNEVLEAQSATDVANYAIDNGMTIFDALLEQDNETVTLTTGAHTEGTVYTLSVSAVADASGNAMALTEKTYSPVLTDPDLMAHWTLDEGEGTIAGDATGNGNDGSLVNGPVWTSGGLNGALLFDGQNDHVVVDSAPLDMNTWNAISVGAWIKNDVGAGAGTDDILSHWDYPSSRSWVLTHHRNNQYFWEIQGKGYVTGGSVGSDWTYVMGTYDGAAMRLYVNGVQVASAGGLSGNLPACTADLIMGGQADGANYFHGIIDEVQIYRRALSDGEIQALYSGSGQANIPPTVSASASPQEGPVPLTVEFFGDGHDDDGFVDSYDWDFGDGETSTAQNPVHTYDVSGDYTAQVTVTDDQGATAFDTIDISAEPEPGGPTLINLWYGLAQGFGHVGNAQVWANVLGNVCDPDEISYLTYRLNGGSPINLSTGPDDRRLSANGDFNIDIDLAALQLGPNAVEITATDSLGDETTETVLLQYADNTWPLPYSIYWGDVTSILDVVQVVDGLWGITPAGIRTVESGYDRILAVGDLDWGDYEVTVSITVHDFDAGPLPPYSTSAGLGMTMRWTGHTDFPVTCPQPHCGWLPSGAGAWYDMGNGGPLTLDGEDDWTVTIDPEVLYVWKLRVETVESLGPLYSLKVWEGGRDEPTAWNLQKQRGLSDETNGSVIFNLHHVDATFGDLTVVPINGGPDEIPPTVHSVRAGSETQVMVVFSEDLDPVTSTNMSNYSIDNGITISDASLGSDSRTVTLTTAPHTQGLTYTLDVSGVTDEADPPNVMDPVWLQYSFSPLQPMLQYLFDETEGTVAADTSGNGYDGILTNGPAWVDDAQKGNVISLDGVNDHVAIDPFPAMDTWTEMTVAAWVNNDTGVGAGTDDILSWWKWNGYPCSECSFVLTHHGNNAYFFQLGDTYVSGGSISTDWTYVAATYDGATIRLYVNGTEAASAPYGGGIPFSVGSPIIGGQADGSNYFAGRIGDVEFFDIALTPQEILSRYSDN
ncbi:MAG: LamG-like jellyroll fold domain-containing protein [Thermodesulfobacteriota bacterium]|nr:LamG-like jellyroll fold domain-containing protein [Thermodesulfobacteriota bacterium]